MARPLRLENAGGIYHITSRGGRLEDIYLDGDRANYLNVRTDPHPAVGIQFAADPPMNVQITL